MDTMSDPRHHPADRRVRRRTVRHDAGMTLTEVLVATSMLGMIMVVVVGAIAVVFRGEVGVSAAIAESHDLRQAVNYFHRDVQSGPSDADRYRSTNGAPAGSGCSDDGTGNVFRYDTDERRVAYRRTVQGDRAELDRYVCTSSDGGWVVAEIVNLADALPGAGEVTVSIDDTDGDGRIESVTMTLPRSSGAERVTASPQSRRTGVEAPVGLASCTDDPLAGAFGFGAFVRGDVVLGDGEVDGPLAVGGSLRWNDDIELSRNDKNQDYAGVALYTTRIDWTRADDRLEVDGGDVVIGGEFHERRGTVYEDRRARSNELDAKRSVVGLDAVSVLGRSPIDFGEHFELLRTCSNLIAELPETCVDCAVDVVPLDRRCRDEYGGNGDLCLELSSQGVQVLTIPETVLDTVDEFDLGGPGLARSRPLVVNVVDDGDGHVRMRSDTSAWSSRGDARFVLFNFPDATSVEFVDDFAGTILAPFAVVTTHDDVLGGVVAAGWTHTGGTVGNGANDVFDATIDWS